MIWWRTLALLLSVVVGIACQSSGGRDADGVALAAWQLPDDVGSFTRVDKTLDLDTRELIGSYRSTDPAAVVGTIFVYPAPGVGSLGATAAAREAALELVTEQEFRGAMTMIESAHPESKLLNEGPVDIRPGGTERSGYLATYTFHEPFFGPPTDLTSHVYIFRFGDWTVKYRFTYAARDGDQATAQIEAFVDGLAWPAQ